MGGDPISTQEFKRRLTAILSADVEGYSRLMRQDEEATVRTITSYRKAMTHLIEHFRGRVVDSPGDNILAEFTSVVDALNCAVEVQQDLAQRNAGLPENSRMQFRIGLNLGDVLEEGKRIYGDGVNIAARMETLSEAGGICISGTVYDAVESKVGLGYEYLGEHQVKNIDKPIRAYRVVSNPGDVSRGVVKAKTMMAAKWRNTMIAIAVIIVAGTAFTVWDYYWRVPKIEPASKEKMALPLPDKPSIAVMPFLNMSNDPRQEYFADGLSESIITALARVPELFVISRESTFSYKGEAVKVGRIAEELGVHYVLEGSVQKEKNKMRITAQLIDALKGNHLWADRYDRKLEDLFAIQDDITQNIITSIQVKLKKGNIAPIFSKGTNNLDAYLKVLEANWYIAQTTRESIATARQLAEEAIAMDPEFGSAYYVLGIVSLAEAHTGFSKNPGASLELSNKMCLKAVELDGSLAAASALRGFILLMLRRYDEGVAVAEHAYQIAPNTTVVMYWYGTVLLFVGRGEEALSVLKKVLRLNPMGSNALYRSLGAACRVTGRYDDSILFLKKATDRNPDDLIAQVALVGAFIMAGRGEEAHAAAREVLRINPRFSVALYIMAQPFKDAAFKESYAEALRKAGLPN